MHNLPKSLGHAGLSWARGAFSFLLSAQRRRRFQSRRHVVSRRRAGVTVS